MTSGAAGAVLDLLEDGSDEFTSSHGLALVQNLSVGYPMFSKDLIRRGSAARCSSPLPHPKYEVERGNARGLAS